MRGRAAIGKELEADRPILDDVVIHYPPEATQRCFALVDCNNFYASCERVFNPKLKGKPIVVLSSNDACIVALSNEAKVFDIKVGAPFFENEHIVKKHNIVVCSSNFNLYGDMSRRVMSILGNFVPEMEVYSIDEAFLNLEGMGSNYLPIPQQAVGDQNKRDITEYAKTIRATILKWTGLPVSIGLARTKVLAKIANRLAKKSLKAKGVLNLIDSPHMDKALAKIHVVDVWGIGNRSAQKLVEKGICTALAFRDVSESRVRNTMGINGLRIQAELRVISCYEMDHVQQPRKGILCSQSFGRKIRDITQLKEAITAFVSNASSRLREQGSAARLLTVFLINDKNDLWDEKNSDSASIKLSEGCDNSLELIKQAMILVDKQFQQGKYYKRAGVRFDDLIPAANIQTSLFDSKSIDKSNALMETVDMLNDKLGYGALRYATQGTIHPWKAKSEMVSPRYTTNWDELVEVSAK